jgi:hypothetical protein
VIMAASQSTTLGNSSRQKLVRRACDPCKVRKIKCSEVSPCRGCIAAGISCTFKKPQARRGPRSLRAKTVRLIREDLGNGRSPGEASTASPLTSDLEDILEIYAARLFPIWPIVDAGSLSRELATAAPNPRTRSLAEAVALATVAQLKLDVSWRGDIKQVEHCAQDETDQLLDSLRLSFFLHICYENKTAGGVKSLLYLREAIAKAQLLRLDREATYVSLQAHDQRLYRRILWLLFVTERYENLEYLVHRQEGQHLQNTEASRCCITFQSS